MVSADESTGGTSADEAADSALGGEPLADGEADDVEITHVNVVSEQKPEPKPCRLDALRQELLQLQIALEQRRRSQRVSTSRPVNIFYVCSSTVVFHTKMAG